MQEDLHCPFQKRLHLSVATHGECTLNGNEITVICLVSWKMLWDYQRCWLMEILTTSDKKNRQLMASLRTTLGIIHQLLFVICAVYCNAFPCNSSTVMQLPGQPAISPLQRQIRGKPVVLLKKQTVFLSTVSVHTEILFFAFFCGYFIQIIMYSFTAKNEIWNQVLEVLQNDTCILCNFY